jgi:O-antigen ligase
MREYISKLKNFSFYEWILFAFPFSLVLGSFYVNLLLILVSFLFVYQILKKKLFFKINLTWVHFYIFFILYNIMRGFFASDHFAAIQNSFSQFRFLFLALFIYLFIDNKESIKTMLLGWLILISFVCFDSIYQYFFLKDIFGYKIVAGYPEGSIRLTGPFGNRLVVGSFVTLISIPIINYYFKKIKDFFFFKKIFFIFLYFIIASTILLSGERLAFFIFFGSSILIFIFYLDFKRIVLCTIFILLFITVAYFKIDTFRTRINNSYDILSNFYNSSYGRLYESSYLLFKKNYIFGVGLKNYRVDCDHQIDPRPESPYQFCSTHPHNFYLEVLTETGLVGFIIFISSFVYLLVFINREMNKNNLSFKKFSSIAYGSSIVLLIYFWPLKTSGSFFTTWNGSFFWFNLGILLLMTKKDKKN